MKEPLELGTVVRDEDGTLWVRTQQDSWPWIGWGATGAYSNEWSEIPDPSLVHAGYAPPTPEPIHQGARVVDAESRKLVRYGREDAHNSWIDIDGLCRQWSELPQPVTVISDGADW